MPKTLLSMKLKLLRNLPWKNPTLLFMGSLNLQLQIRLTEKVLTSCSTSFLRTVDFRRRAWISQLFGEWSLMQYLLHEQKMASGPTTLVPSGEEMLGLTHSALRYLLEQFPGAPKATTNEWKHQEPPPPPEVVKENPTGSARSEPYRGRKERDMFAWLASRHRKMPIPTLVSSCLPNWLLRPI